MADLLDIDATLDLPGFRLEARVAFPLRGITALTGPSGSGKTTLLRLIAGLEPAARGRMRFAGQDWMGGKNSETAAKRRIGMVFQDTRLFGHLSVAGNIAYGARRSGVPQGRVDELAQALDLGPLLARSVDDLSGGEARRVALARALARDPQLLLLDEPLAGLDAMRRAEAMAMIARVVRDSAVPAIYVSHSSDEVAALADRVIAVEGGRVLGVQAPPLMLRGELVRDEGRTLIVFGDSRISVPDTNTPTGPAVLSISAADVIVSTQDPGPTSAALTLLGHVASVGEDGALELAVANQRLNLSADDRLLSKCPDSGAQIWLSATRIWMRPS